jgi:monothiol glutaredoxin
MTETNPIREDAMSETNPIRDAIQQAIDEHPVILFMKGTPEQPGCGFSARTVAALQSLGAPFAAVDVLPDARIRQELSAISNWPTIPQLFVDGELIGGCDIVTEMLASGELAEALGVEQPPDAPAAVPGGSPPKASATAGETEPAPQPLPIENRLG